MCIWHNPWALFSQVSDMPANTNIYFLMSECRFKGHRGIHKLINSQVRGTIAALVGKIQQIWAIKSFMFLFSNWIIAYGQDVELHITVVLMELRWATKEVWIGLARVEQNQLPSEIDYVNNTRYMSCNYNLDDNAHVQKSGLKWQFTSRFARPIIYGSYVAVVFKDKQDDALCFKQLLSSMQTLNCP